MHDDGKEFNCGEIILSKIFLTMRFGNEMVQEAPSHHKRKKKVTSQEWACGIKGCAMTCVYWNYQKPCLD